MGRPKGHRPRRHVGNAALDRNRRGREGERRILDLRPRTAIRQSRAGLRAALGRKETRPRSHPELSPAGGAGSRHRPRSSALGDRTRRAAARPGNAGSAHRPGAAGRDIEEPPPGNRRKRRQGEMVGARGAHPGPFPDRVERTLLHAGPALHPVRIPRVGPQPPARSLQCRKRDAPGAPPARLPVRPARHGDPARRARCAPAHHLAKAGVRPASQGRP